jgi:serine/threonine-protein kinase
MTLDALPRLSAALADRYRIERELGAGGMATVYLAHDIKHDRDVAIKVLHPDLGAALGSERFLSEIRTTARLQHPHILPLLDSGDASGLLYYVMPVVTGETLRARLMREQQLPIPDAVRIAREVASALDYAHRQGVIHRDIKPENILLHDGQALVADFGIALAVQTAGGTRMTQTGLSLGTPQYMSPEQAMGERQIDARADVYAVGAVTYEMLVGEPPFTGPTVQAIVAKVLSERPTPLHTIRDTVPPGIEQAVLTALAKLPADRFATSAEFATALANPTVATTALYAPTRQRLRSNRPAQFVAGAAVVAVAVGVWGWTGRHQHGTPPAIVKVSITIPQSVFMRTGYGGLALSADGSKFAYISADSSAVPRLFVRALNEFNTIPVSGGKSPSSAAFSPDGGSIAFVSSPEVWVVSTGGGTPRRLTAGVNTVRGMTWGGDSTIVVASAGALVRVSANAGHIDTLAVPALGGASFRSPTFATRDLVLFDIDGDSARNGLAAISLSTKRVTRLGIAGSKPTLVQGHLLVYFTPDGSIWAIEFDPRSLKTAGSARQIADQVSSTAFGIPRGAVAANGTILYAIGARTDHRELVLVDRTGHARNIGGAQRAYRFPRFSPEGRRIAVTLENVSGVATGDIYVLGLEGGTPLRLTTDSSSYQAEWDPDGTSLIYAHRQAGSSALFRVDADGSGRPPVKLLTRPYPIYESRITPDHHTIIWREDNPKTLRDILSAPMDSLDNVRPILATAFDEKGIAMSPDGHWLAYSSNETGINEVYIRRLEPNSPRWPVSSRGGTEPRWSKSGEIFFRRGDSVFASRVTPGPVPQIGAAITLFSGIYAATNYEPVWDVAPDGLHFAMVRLPEAETPQLILFMNWAEHWNTPRP